MALKTLKAKDLQLADVVRLKGNDSAWVSCVVKQIMPEEVTLFRPYGHSADFSYTGGVICYTGVEEWKVWIKSDIEFELFSRKDLK